MMPDAGFTFKWGRVDCDTAPYAPDVHHTFPEPVMSRTEMMDFFLTEFDMGETEAM